MMIDPQIPMRLGAEVDDLRAENARLREKLARAIEAAVLAEKQEPNTFQREIRYEVRKLKTGKLVDCVVVEADWPEYETVWKMIQDRVDGKKQEPVKDEPDFFAVVDETGAPEFTALWPEFCHEHINCAINEFDIEGAAKWKVVPLYTRPQPDLTAEVERLKVQINSLKVAAHRMREDTQRDKQRIAELEAENLRVRTQRNELRAQVQQLTGDLRERASKRSKERIAELESEVERLRQICRDAYEVWAGSNGMPEPITCVEAYLLQLLIQMRDEVKRGLK